MKSRCFQASARALAAAFACFAAGALAQPVEVSDAWVRATVPGQRSAGAYMQLRSAAGARVVGAASTLAKVVEIHEMKLDAGVMTMRAIERLELPPGKPVLLSPGGHHVMLMGLAQPLKAGDRVPLTLVVEDASGRRHDVALTATVRTMTAPSGAAK